MTWHLPNNHTINIILSVSHWRHLFSTYTRSIYFHIASCEQPDDVNHLIIESDDKAIDAISSVPPAPKDDENSTTKAKSITTSDNTKLQSNDNTNTSSKDDAKPSFNHDTKHASGTEQPSGNDVEEEGQWNLMAILGASQIRKEERKCQHETCSLVACSIWVQEGSEEDPWYSCFDCQETDFGIDGFGPDLPIKFMAAEHKCLIAKKCTRQDAAKMPNLPEQAPKPGAVTPPPGKVVIGGAKQLREAASSKGTKAKGSAITPSPVPPRGAGGKKSKSTKPNATHSAVQKKWQEAAEKAGGPGARIITNKTEAKKIVFDMLHDSFRPMNMTEIYNELKATIPSMILKSCLDDMALDRKTNPFDEESSDDEDGNGKKKTSGKMSGNAASIVSSDYAGALTMKPGRNVNTTLYFVNHNSSYVANNGNGLPADERNNFLADFESKKSELLLSQARLRDMNTETIQLLSEPTNDALDENLNTQENEMDGLKEELKASRALKDNEKLRRKMAKSVDMLTTTWRKRKRTCMDFLIQMEEMTEGSVTVKKCLAGDGPIDVGKFTFIALALLIMNLNLLYSIHMCHGI